VVPATARGKGRLCKQCGNGYRISRSKPAAFPLPANSNADMQRLAGHPQRVFLIN
jgi:hypothetical protein